MRYDVGKDHIYKNKKLTYNEYNTLGMQWAYNVSTNVGDQKILYNSKKGKYYLVEATKDDMGFIELASGTRKQLERIKNGYINTETKTFNNVLQIIGNESRNNGWDNDDARYNDETGENGKISIGVSEYEQATNRAGDTSQIGRDSEGVIADTETRHDDRDITQSSRYILANALASTAQNDIEKKYIEQYQSKIESINEQQDKLTALRAEICRI